MQSISREDYQARVDRLLEILSGIADHAAQISTGRCPYKDRLNRCTAQFGCRNKRRSVGADGSAIVLCAGDDKLDYRSAWDTR